jgi:MoaA/NifB/PqqE/SkfB family radical SAM enzyme
MNARFLELEITGKCDQHCEHCYGSFPKKGELPKDKVMQIIDEAHDYFDCIVFSGGEPFLHPHLMELIHYAKDYVVFITTSGYSLGKEQIERLKGNMVLVFSVDGIGKVHDYYRGRPGAFKRLIRSLELTKELPKEIIVTLWKGVIPQMEEIIDLAIKYKALLHFNALIPVGRAKGNRKILLTKEGSEEVYKKLQELRINRESFLVTDLYKVTEKDLAGIDLFCKGRYSINPRGDVRPCEFHSEVLGNIFKEHLDEIVERARETYFIKSREEGFREEVRLGLKNPFNYHTEICHALSKGHPFDFKDRFA